MPLAHCLIIAPSVNQREKYHHKISSVIIRERVSKNSLNCSTAGWSDIGYNFLIGGDGNAYMGRGWDRVGAHTVGYNDISVAFSLIGNFEEDPVPSIMQTATQNLIKCATSRVR